MPRDDRAKTPGSYADASVASSVAPNGPSRPGSAILGLLLTPVVVGIAALALPNLHVSSAAADAVVFLGVASTTMAALALAATGVFIVPIQIAIAACSAVALGLLAWIGVTSASFAVVVDTALVALAWTIGAAIGRRIEHPGHLLPACVVVACADATSALSQFGPTHAIAENDRALSVLAVSFPVPGMGSFAPALGVGDLIFVSIVFGAVAVHRLSLPRAALLAWLGALAAGAASAWFGAAVPALVPMGAAIVLGLPRARRLRPRDRRAAILAMTIAAAVAATVIVAQLVHPATDNVAR